MAYTASGDPGRLTMEELFRLLATRKYHGSIVVHFNNGRPLVAEYGRPNQIEIAPRLNGAAASPAAAAAAHAVRPAEIEMELEVVRGPALPDLIR